MTRRLALICLAAFASLGSHAQNDHEAAFLQAFDDRDLVRCKEFIERGFSIDSLMLGDEPYMFALLNSGTRRVAKVRDLLNLGASASARNKSGFTALELLLSKKDLTNLDLELIRVLVANGAHQGIKGLFARLLLAKNLTARVFEAVDILLENGVSINEKDAEGQTVLQLLLLQEVGENTMSADAFKKLVGRGAQASDIRAVLIGALVARNVKVVHYILEERMETRANALLLATEHADEFVVEHLLFLEN
jgi:hypothetical protein